MSQVKVNQVQKNIVISVIAQIISLCVSFLLNLVVPKYIDEYQYAYWQTYILYVGYVGVLHFGLLDGIVLRYSHYDYDELDKQRISSQFKLLCCFLSIISGIIISIGLAFCTGTMKKLVILVAIGVITKNIITYSFFSVQMTNQINKYCILVIVQRLSYGFLVIGLLVLHIKEFEWYCIADLFGDCVGIILAFFLNKEMYFGKMSSFLENIKEWKNNVSAGLILLLANLSGSLLLGIAKIIIQKQWGNFTFGKIAFAFSVSNLFLTFISAISVVLFPSLKRMEQDKLPLLYKKIREGSSVLLFCVMLLYFPGCWILKNILPTYTQSLVYLGTLLPFIVYSTKVSLLTNNYLKAYRKERDMLYVNLFSVGIALLVFSISAFILQSLEIVLICIVFVIMLNSILSEFVVMKTIKIEFAKEFIIEAIMSIGFILIVKQFSLLKAFGIYGICLIMYLMYKWKFVVSIIKKIKINVYGFSKM